MKKIWKDFMDVYIREFKLVFSDQGIMLFLFFLPLAYPVIYSLIYNPEVVRDVKVVVVDHDCTRQSRELARKLDSTQEIWIKGYAADMGEARHAMDSHACYGILEIPKGFGKNTERGEQAHAVFYSEMSLLLRYRSFLIGTTSIMQEMGAELLAGDINREIPLAGTLVPVSLLPIDDVNLGNPAGGFDSFIMPGMLILILQQSIILAVGMAGGAKRERRSRLGYQPVNMTKSTLLTMGGQAACYMTLLILPIIWLIHYVPLIFQFPMAGNTFEIFCFVLPITLGSILMGFCVQGIVMEREEIFVIWVATSLVFLFLSGLTWPRYAITGIWRWMSDIIPATWGVEGFVKMNSNGSSLAQVRDIYLNAWLLCVAYGVIAWGVQRWVVRPQELKIMEERGRTPSTAGLKEL